MYCIKHWAANDEDYAVNGILSDWCAETVNIRIEYSILSVCVMLIFFIRMSDFAVMNNTLSAYVIMAIECLQEVFLFLVALSFVIFAFSASTLALFETNMNFKDIPQILNILFFVFVGEMVSIAVV